MVDLGEAERHDAAMTGGRLLRPATGAWEWVATDGVIVMEYATGDSMTIADIYEPADAAGIAYMRNTLPAFVAEVKALRAENERLTERLETKRGAYREAADWITTVQLHYGLGPEASPEDIFMVAAESRAALTEGVTAHEEPRVGDLGIEFGALRKAVEHADGKHGENLHLTDLEWFAVLGEEFGEVARDVTMREVPPVVLTADSPKLRDLRDELLQVAATAARWVRAIDERPI